MLTLDIFLLILETFAIFSLLYVASRGHISLLVYLLTIKLYFVEFVVFRSRKPLETSESVSTFQNRSTSSDPRREIRVASRYFCVIDRAKYLGEVKTPTLFLHYRA